MKKLSFFDRLSGGGYEDDFVEDTVEMPMQHQHVQGTQVMSTPGQLPVDMYDTGPTLIVRAFVAGVRPDEVDVSIARDKVEILGSREERETITDSNYIHRELFWGSFARTIPLPVEVDVDQATAVSKDGLVTITLPKLDKARQTKLRVRGN